VSGPIKKELVLNIDDKTINDIGRIIRFWTHKTNYTQIIEGSHGNACTTVADDISEVISM
jgi:hypothetical protein